MTHMEMFCQCRMARGNRSTIGFIPVTAARAGNIIGLEPANGMDRGWRVESVGALIAKEAMRLFERQHTRQRAVSDLGAKPSVGSGPAHEHYKTHIARQGPWRVSISL